MELPFALALLAGLLVLAWAAPEAVAVAFVIAVGIEALAIGLALLARASRGPR